jgi:hypothetical protein
MKTAVAALLLLAVMARGQGRIVWDESVNGVLGNSPAAATSLGDFGPGTNSLIGSVEAYPTEFGWSGVSDYFAFGIPTGFSVSAISLQVDQQILAWTGNDWGTQVGYRETAGAENILPYIATQGLTSGSYVMYVSDEYLAAVPTSVPYRLDFIVTTVPEPSPFLLTALGVAVFLFRRRARR